MCHPYPNICHRLQKKRINENTYHEADTIGMSHLLQCTCERLKILTHLIKCLLPVNRTTLFRPANPNIIMDKHILSYYCMISGHQLLFRYSIHQISRPGLVRQDTTYMYIFIHCKPQGFYVTAHAKLSHLSANFTTSYEP